MVAAGSVAWLQSALVLACYCASATPTMYRGSKRVGILHSMTGPLAISETGVINAVKLAIDEINNSTGLLGYRIDAITEDGESDPLVFREKAENLTRVDPSTQKSITSAVFGCWSSDSRKAVLPVFEKNDHLLFYPVQYEGQECSQNIFYTGATPNQQIEPAVTWLLRHKAKKFFLVGSDYVFPRTANDIARHQTAALGGSVVGEEYFKLGELNETFIREKIALIRQALPDGGVIFNTINGDTNKPFFKVAYEEGLRASEYPIMSVSITETEVKYIGAHYLEGHYAAWNYFMSTSQYKPMCGRSFNPGKSASFVDAYRSVHGQGALVNDPMESAYVGVKLWAQAVELIGSFDIVKVRQALIGQAYSAPEGDVVMNENHHLSKYVRIGQVRVDGMFHHVYESLGLVYPQPWNQWVPNSTGYACNWRLQGRGSRYLVTSKKVALIYPLNGSDQDDGWHYLDAQKAAIQDINAAGGLHGKYMLEPVIFNTQSQTSLAIEKMREIDEMDSDDPNRPVAIFTAGVDWPGAPAPSEKDDDDAVLRLVASSDYVTSGEQCSANVLKFGSLPNQRVMLALQYFTDDARDDSWNNVYLMISDAWEDSGRVPALMRKIKELNVTLVGTSVARNVSEMGKLVENIKASMDHGVVLNLLSDATLARAFLAEAKRQEMSAGVYRVVFTSMSAAGARQLGHLLKNQLVHCSYTPDIETSDSIAFVQTMRNLYGRESNISSMSETAYTALRFWAESVDAAKSFKPVSVRRAMYSQTFSSPAGTVQMHHSNHLQGPSFLATLNIKGDGLRIVSGSAQMILPDPRWLEPSADASSCVFHACLPGEYPMQDGACRACTIYVFQACADTWYLLIAAVVLVCLVALLWVICARRRRRQADSIWMVDVSELQFCMPAEVLGTGTFGLVVKAEYRGTTVAVKRVMPPPGKRTMTGLFGVQKGQESGDWTLDEGSAKGESDVSERHNKSKPLTAAWTLWSHERRKLKTDFIQEMRLLSKIRHPCVTTVMGAVIHGPEPMLVMELMEHGSLYDCLHNETLFIDGDFLCPVLRDIVSGMRFLHTGRPAIIHGDLKAQNVLVDTRFRAKVADFGLSQKKKVGGIGTPLWMAPELLRGETVISPETDCYAFGILLIEVFTRQEPYHGQTPANVLRAVADARQEKRPEIPSDCNRVMASTMRDCWASDPALRPSFEELDRRFKSIDASCLCPGDSPSLDFAGRLRSLRRPTDVSSRGSKRAETNLLHDVFPKHVAEALIRGDKVEPEHKDEVTIFFSDIVGFTNISSTLDPHKVSLMLDCLYSKFDQLSRQFNVFKVETIGDAYMAVANLVENQQHDHAKRIALFAISAIEVAKETLIDADDPSKGCINIRVGFHTGPVVASVVGTRNKRYCLLSDTVNTASRMESNSVQNFILCSAQAASVMRQQVPEIKLFSRGELDIKGKGKMETFWVHSIPPPDLAPPPPPPVEPARMQFAAQQKDKEATLEQRSKSTSVGGFHVLTWPLPTRGSSFERVSPRESEHGNSPICFV